VLTDLERRPVLAVLNGVRFVVWHIIGRPRVLPKNALVAERRTVALGGGVSEASRPRRRSSPCYRPIWESLGHSQPRVQ
jgi:hypothetical protein